MNEKKIKCPDCREDIKSGFLKDHILSCKKYKANLLQNTTKLAEHLNQDYLIFLMTQMELAKEMIQKKIYGTPEKLIKEVNNVQNFDQLFSASNGKKKHQNEGKQQNHRLPSKELKKTEQINNSKPKNFAFESTIRLDNPWNNREDNIMIPQKQFDQMMKNKQRLKSIDYVKCENCQKNIDARNIDQFAYTYLCFHLLCINCLKSYIEDKYTECQGTLKCLKKDCDSEITSGQIKDIIGKQKFEEYQNLVVRKMINTMNLVKCSRCRNEYQFVQGTVRDAPKKDQQGKKVTKAAAQHYAKNRFMCPNQKCKQQQCRQCKQTPYHLGLTCEQNQQFKLAKKCRYCKSVLKKGYTSNKGIRAFDDVCPKKQCQKITKTACSKIHKCKDPCLGYISEKQCLPCLKSQCCKQTVKHDQNEESYCSVCYVQQLKEAPCVMGKCGHIFHFHCIAKRLEIKWLTPRIIFNFCLCPLCKQWIDLPQDCSLTKQIQKLKELYATIKQKALKRLKHENLQNDKKIKDERSQYFNKPTDYAMAIYAYFQCYKCKKPYFGGRKNCAEMMDAGEGKQSQEYDATKLVCPQCCPISTKNCEKHGKDFISFKCKFCCNIAQWFCWGSTHFCDDCHTRQAKGEYLSKLPKQKLPKCQGSGKCPIGGDHIQNGQQLNLGCMLCRDYKKEISEF